MVSYGVYIDGSWACDPVIPVKPPASPCAAFPSIVSRKSAASKCNKRCKSYSDCTAWKVKANGMWPVKGKGDSWCHLFKEIKWKYYPWVTFRKKNGVWRTAWNHRNRMNFTDMWLYGKRQDC